MSRRRPTWQSDLGIVVRGMMMGAADVVPGVSGGTVALIVGIYERLVTAISHVDAQLLQHLRGRQWKAAADHLDLRFLVCLASGIAISIGLLARALTYLLEHHPQPTLAVFFGLIVASSYLVACMVRSWDPPGMALAVLAAVFAFWLTGQVPTEHQLSYGYVFLCGMIGICAMILPGISGAFLLLILGVYHGIVGIVRDLTHGHITVETLGIAATFGLGCLVGLLSFSKCLRWLLARHHARTMAVLCGFMIGSLRRVWPFQRELGDHDFVAYWPGVEELLLPAGLALIAGFFVLGVERVANRNELEPPLSPDDHEPDEPPPTRTPRAESARQS